MVTRSSSVADRKTRVAISLRLATRSLRMEVLKQLKTPGKTGGIVWPEGEFARPEDYSVADVHRSARLRPRRLRPRGCSQCGRTDLCGVTEGDRSAPAAL